MNHLYKNILIATIFFLCGLILLWVVTLYLEKVPDAQSLPTINKETNDKIFSDPPAVEIVPTPSSGVPNTVAPDEAISEISSILYRDNIFTPAHILLTQNKTGVGCYINVVNASSNTLIIRLGPPEVGKEKGFPYPPIAPGQSALIDPRYSGITQALFYNTALPTASFTVNLDQTCRE